MSELLKTIYASAPIEHVIIQTLQISVPNHPVIYLCGGFEDIEAKLEDSTSVTFEAGNLGISLPSIDDKKGQTLNFSLWNVADRAQKAVEAALMASTRTKVYYREYSTADLNTPLSAPVEFTMLGGSFEGMSVTIQAGYFDILATAWPRLRYTSENAPAIKYL